MSKHEKHPPLARRHRGHFGHREVSLIGAPCDVLRRSAEELQSLFPERQLGYFDADHHPDTLEDRLTLLWTDHQEYSSIRKHRREIDWDLRSLSSDLDAAVVNGNHFTASAQIVYIHPKKLESLSRKTDRLTDVRAVVFCEDESELPTFLKAHVSEDTPIFKEKDAEFGEWFHASFLKAPPIKGLVLAGGQSTRMGQDKGSMSFHGKPQREFLAEMLEDLGLETYISCRSEQAAAISSWGNPLPDRIIDFGPYGALITAFMSDPDSAWLVVACDLPGLDGLALQTLISNRAPGKVATAFRKHAEAFPEPLITLWEPRSYPRLLAFMAQGNSCPRKVLINSDIAVMDVPNPKWIANVNTPDEAANWLQG